MRCSRTRPGDVVRIITGRGNRSAGPAVLQPLVGRLLRGPLSRYVADERADVGGGAFLVSYDKASGAVETYDGRETAPAATTMRRPIR